jgi:hypothetical protein
VGLLAHGGAVVSAVEIAFVVLAVGALLLNAYVTWLVIRSGL